MRLTRGRNSNCPFQLRFLWPEEEYWRLFVVVAAVVVAVVVLVFLFFIIGEGGGGRGKGRLHIL